MSQSFDNDRFESQLSALFDEPPSFDDNAAFAASVTAGLERKARLRAQLTWGAAALGAVFAAVGLSQAPDLGFSSALADAADNYGATTLWLGLGVALAVWAALPMLGGSEA